MYVIKIFDSYDNITFSNSTDNENNIDITISTFLLAIPCGLSFLCLLSLVMFTMIKLLLLNK